MKRVDSSIIWGALLVVAGALFLLQNFISVDRAWEALWALLFAAGGVTFLWFFLADRGRSWWAAIPGFALFGIAGVLALTSLGFGTDGSEGSWLGSVFLGMLSLGFWAVYLVRREHWWAVIPGGVLLTLAAVALVSPWFEGTVAGSIFFFGLAITFALLYFLPIPERHMTWPIIPAIVLAALGLVTAMASASAASYVWSLALILAGLYLIYRQFGGGAMAHRR